MIASINPCGFALLPAYVGAFVAGDNTSVRADRRIVRAVGVSAAVSVGFAAMFIIVGVIFSATSSALRQQMPWVTIAVGIAMLSMGVASIAGWKPRLPFQNRTSVARRDVVGMAGFGFTYALVSLSCTLGPFLSVSAFAMQRSFIGGIATYLMYAAGMATIILALSVSAALAHDSFVGTLRNASKYAPRLAGALLVLSGGYAIWYGRYELAVYAGNLSDDSIVALGTNLQTQFVVFTSSVGSTRIALAIVAATAAAYMAVRIRNSSRDNLTTPNPPSEAAARETSRTT
jgi:cytochrome c-type biogenesis protein